LNDDQYLEAIEENGDEFDARMGAEAVYELLRTLDMPKEIERMREDIQNTNSETKIKKIAKRLKLLESLDASGNRPEWMIPDCIASIATRASSACSIGWRSFCDL
jgi:DNA-directed RNA polymerase subunit beta'